MWFSQWFFNLSFDSDIWFNSSNLCSLLKCNSTWYNYRWTHFACINIKMRPPRVLICWRQQLIIFQINPSQHLKISTRLKIYKEATNDIQRTIKLKNKQQYLEKKLSENIAKPNELRQTLKSKGLSISIKYIFEKQKWFIIRITISSGNV